MTIHLRKITRKYRDPHAEARARIHAQLAAEIAEERISRTLVEKHNARVRQSAEYRQNGGA